MKCWFKKSQRKHTNRILFFCRLKIIMKCSRRNWVKTSQFHRSHTWVLLLNSKQNPLFKVFISTKKMLVFRNVGLGNLIWFVLQKWKMLIVLNRNVACFMFPLLRLRRNSPPLSLAPGARRAPPPRCQNIAVCTSALSRRLSGASCAAFKMVNPQKNSSRKVSWWSWWARGWWTPCAPRLSVDSQTRASCARATTCALYWNSWRWQPRRRLCTSQRNSPFMRRRSLQ